MIDLYVSCGFGTMIMVLSALEIAKTENTPGYRYLKSVPFKIAVITLFFCGIVWPLVWYEIFVNKKDIV